MSEEKSNEQDAVKTRVDADGMIYEWNEKLKAWFPKVTDEFLAYYQASYGFNDVEDPVPTKVETAEPITNPGSGKKKKKCAESSAPKPKQPPAWFEIDDSKNNNVYVSGLPHDVTEEELGAFMSKCGIVARDPTTDALKVKIYKDKDGKSKGDGLCCYLKHESVALALSILDGGLIRENNVVHVEQAKFELKGDYKPSMKKRKRKKKDNQEKLLDWVDRGEKKKKHMNVVVLKNVFDVAELDDKPDLLIDIKAQLRALGTGFGKVRKVMVFDRHPEGICSILLDSHENALTCQETINYKKMRGRRVLTSIWDGITDYNVQDNAKEVKRLQAWEEYLEQ